MFASLVANLYCLVSRAAGARLRPDSRIRTPLRVVGSAPRVGLTCRFKRS